jgi:hypothetical protein
MGYSDTDPVDGHLQPPAVDSSGIEDLIADQSVQVQVVNWIFEQVTGESLVETIITPITGDWTRIAANGEAWRSAGNAVEAISNNLTANVDTLQQFWTGNAAESFGTHIRTVWFGGLFAEAALAKLIAEGFDFVSSICEQLCREAMDLLEKLVNKLLSAISTSWIPFVGWARAVKLVWDAYNIYQDIRAIIDAIRGVIEAAQQLFDAVGRIQNALEMIPDVRNANDAVAVARELNAGVNDAVDAAESVQGNVEDARGTFQESTAGIGAGSSSSGTSSGGAGGGGGSW